MCSDVIFPRDSSHNQTAHRSTCSPNRSGGVLDELAVDQRNNGSVFINVAVATISNKTVTLDHYPTKYIKLCETLDFEKLPLAYLSKYELADDKVTACNCRRTVSNKTGQTQLFEILTT
jgi:hypothetical protein